MAGAARKLAAMSGDVSQQLAVAFIAERSGRVYRFREPVVIALVHGFHPHIDDVGGAAEFRISARSLGPSAAISRDIPGFVFLRLASPDLPEHWPVRGTGALSLLA